MKGLASLGLPIFLAAAVACSPRPAGSSTPADDTTSGMSADQQHQWNDIQQAETRAKGLVHTEKCATAGECRTAPVGAVACGGPRYYLTYCPASTDTAALNRLLDRIKTMETAYNKKWRIMSSCLFRTPPVPGIVGGSCQDSGSAP
jgi:hypothetical protein